MAITTLDGYLAAFKHHLQMGKTNSVTTVAGVFSSVFDRAGFPTAGALSPGNTTTGLVPTDATTGFPSIAAFQGGAKGYLSRVEAQWNVAGSLALFDVLFWAGQTLIPTSGTTTVTLSTQPSFAGRVPFASDGATRNYQGETELWLWSSVAWSNHAHTVSVTYDGPGGNNLTTPTVSTQNRPINTMIRIPWATADAIGGISNVDSYAVNGIASAAGQVVLLVLRRLWTGRVVANTLAVAGPDLTGMPEVFDTSALLLAVLPESTSSALPNVFIEIAEG